MQKKNESCERSDCPERRRDIAMMTESIIGKYNTTLGKVIVVSPHKEYQVGDTISTNEGEFRIRRIIPRTQPTEPIQFSFVVD